MRKLLKITALSVAVLMASCDMDTMPKSSIGTEGLFNDIASIESLERGAFARLKDNYSIANVLVGDIQADYVNAASGFSNTYGESYFWTFQRNNYEITEVWENCYLTIGQCNFVLDGIQAGIDEGRFTADIMAKLEEIRGRLYLIRAMSYSTLAERFCADYDEATAKNEHTGVPLIEKFDPSNKKPGRATLYAVYERILKDIAAAKTALKGVAGTANAVFLNRDCVTAFEARVYLQMDNYGEALKAANLLIGKSAYALAETEQEFSDIWTYDRGKEIIFKIAASKTELPYTYAIPLYYEQQSGMKVNSTDPQELNYAWRPDYLPTQELIDAYGATDIRAKVWFRTNEWNEKSNREYSYLGAACVFPGYTMISKFPGNPELRTSAQWNFANTWKVFRLAEMYLIAAEAALQSNEPGTAATVLSELRTHRGLTALSTVTLNDIKEERYRELMMEGFRITDLKRWGDPMERGKGQYGQISTWSTAQKQWIHREDYFSNPIARDLVVEAGDYRFVWPIPENEIYANQNLINQQNPGWDR